VSVERETAIKVAPTDVKKSAPGEFSHVFVRYSAAFGFLLYGFAKLWGAQFTILDSELDKPMGHVSGFWLTWYYFGYSRIFGGFIALAQIGGAVFLMFRKTTLVGACALLPAIANIVLIDVCYRISPGATVVALYLLSAIVAILFLHRHELLEVFWWRQNALHKRIGGRGIAAGAWTVRVAMVAGLCAFAYWVANYNNRLPTPIDGSWEVASVESAGQPPSVPAMIFFEHNRARWCTFKLSDGTYQVHDFEVDADKNSLGIWQRWGDDRDKGPQIFSGSYELSSSALTLTGRFTGSPNVSTICLVRKNVRM
jgi:hypothetical protein